MASGSKSTPKSTRLKHALIAVAVVVCTLAGAYAVWHTGRVMSIASAFYAKTLCSGVFVSGRGEREVVAEDVLADMRVGLRHWHGEIDREHNIVTASFLGMAERKALYRPGLGCTLMTGVTAEELLQQVGSFAPPPSVARIDAPWPAGSQVDTDTPAPGVDKAKLKAAIDEAWHDPRPQRMLKRTRAVVVVHKGRIIAERYAPGFGPDTPQPGWSMGKSVLNALVGTLAADGRMKLDQDKLFPEWSGEGDPRAAITVDNLLRMVSGLDFDQPHVRMLSDVRKMLFLEGDSAAYAKSERRADPVGSTWFYASGSTTLLASLMREAVGGGQGAYFSYPRSALFGPLGMTSAVIEPDAAGTFLAPAFVHASARDWARFGLLYLNDGVWQGRRILPEGWVKKSLEPTPASQGQYGAHLWLEIPDFLRPAYSTHHSLPDDAFFMLGHDGQMVAVIPSRDLVVVRLGLSRRRNAWDHEAFLHLVLKAVE